MWIIGIIVAILIGFFMGRAYKNVDLYEAAENHPRGGLDIPAQCERALLFRSGHKTFRSEQCV